MDSLFVSVCFPLVCPSCARGTTTGDPVENSMERRAYKNVRYDSLSSVAIVRQSRAQPPPRPHSADFLEYEATRRPQQQPTQCERPLEQQRRPQRPKSSLDIVNPSDTANDGYFYSEERYVSGQIPLPAISSADAGENEINAVEIFPPSRLYSALSVRVRV